MLMNFVRSACLISFGNADWIKIRCPYLETNSFKYSHDARRDKNVELTLNYSVFVRWIL